jgi:hypothetical protein
MKRALLFFLLVSTVQAAEPITVTKENATAFYQPFARLTQNPRLVPGRVLTLCRSPLPADYEADRKKTGPHTAAYVHVYANPAAAAAIAKNANEFPEGAVIVKEKLGANKQPTDIGGMIKRAQGYDPANGDWEYFYRQESGQFTSGKLANCASCHNAAPKAQVYSAWTLKK